MHARIGFLPAVALAGVICCTLSCGTAPARKTWWNQQEHQAPSSASTSSRFPAMSVATARRKLASARAASKAADAVVYANRLATAGANLSPDEARYVARAIDRLAGDALARLWEHLDKNHTPTPRVALRLALIAYHVADLGGATTKLRGIEAWPTDLKTAARRLTRSIAARQQVDSSVVAVLLPLSGAHAAIGAELRAAIAIAARSADGKGATVHFVDTRGEPSGAVTAVDKAVFEHHAVAILGPVGQRESRAAAARAAELGVPIALMSAGGSANASAGVFRLWSSSRWEAREAVRVAVALGYDRFAVLAPRDAEGAALANEFQRAAVAARAKVIAVGQYNPTGTDLQKDVKAFLGLDPKTNRRLRRHLRRYGWKNGWKSFSPAIKFEVLFIPDDYRVAALVASYLPFFNVEVRSRDIVDVFRLRKKHGGRIPQLVQLMGTSGWHHLGLIPRGGPAVEGALVIEVFAGGDNEEYSTDTGAELSKVFRARTRRTPGALAAQAYDAALLVFRARARAAAKSSSSASSRRRRIPPRVRFRRALVGLELPDGACGLARVTRAGELTREATVLRVDSGEFVLHDR